MGEVTPEVSNDLVEMETKNGVVRKVYPEIAEFFSSRKAAELEWNLYRAEYQKKISDKVYEGAVDSYRAGRSFDEYSARLFVNEAVNTENREAETKYNDFTRTRRRDSVGG